MNRSHPPSPAFDAQRSLRSQLSEAGKRSDKLFQEPGNSFFFTKKRTYYGQNDFHRFILAALQHQLPKKTLLDPDSNDSLHIFLNFETAGTCRPYDHIPAPVFFPCHSFQSSPVFSGTRSLGQNSLRDKHAPVCATSFSRKSAFMAKPMVQSKRRTLQLKMGQLESTGKWMFFFNLFSRCEYHLMSWTGCQLVASCSFW